MKIIAINNKIPFKAVPIEEVQTGTRFTLNTSKYGGNTGDEVIITGTRENNIFGASYRSFFYQNMVSGIEKNDSFQYALNKGITVDYFDRTS